MVPMLNRRSNLIQGLLSRSGSIGLIGAVVAASVTCLRAQQEVPVDWAEALVERKMSLPTLEDHIASGKIAPLRGQLLRVMGQRYANLDVRGNAIRGFVSGRKVALRDESTEELIRVRQPQVAAESRNRRAANLAKRRGRASLGPREREFLQLLDRASTDPDQGRRSLERWLRRNRSALRSEKSAAEARAKAEAELNPSPYRRELPSRDDQIAAAIAKGKIDPDVAEFLRLSQSSSPDPVVQKRAREVLVNRGRIDAAEPAPSVERPNRSR